MDFALTEAKDWPMLITVGSISWLFFNIIVLGLLGLAWRSLPKESDLLQLRKDVNLDIEKIAARWEAVLESHSDRQRNKQEKDVDNLWSEVRRCQETHNKIMLDCQRDCCPRGRMRLEPSE